MESHFGEQDSGHKRHRRQLHQLQMNFELELLFLRHEGHHFAARASLHKQGNIVNHYWKWYWVDTMEHRLESFKNKITDTWVNLSVSLVSKADLYQATDWFHK